MIKTKYVILLSFVLGTYSFEAEARNCVIHHYKATWGLEMPGNMTVKKNFVCTTSITSVGQDDISIIEQAKNGVAKSTSTGATYKPNNNFIGTDEFVFMRKGRDRYGNAAESRVRVSVKVVNDL